MVLGMSLKHLSSAKTSSDLMDKANLSKILLGKRKSNRLEDRSEELKERLDQLVLEITDKV